MVKEPVPRENHHQILSYWQLSHIPQIGFENMNWPVPNSEGGQRAQRKPSPIIPSYWQLSHLPSNWSQTHDSGDSQQQALSQNFTKLLPEIFGCPGDFGGFGCPNATQTPCWLRLWPAVSGKYLTTLLSGLALIFQMLNLNKIRSLRGMQYH